MLVHSLKAEIARQDTKSTTQRDVIYKKFILNIRPVQYFFYLFYQLWGGGLKSHNSDCGFVYFSL